MASQKKWFVFYVCFLVTISSTFAQSIPSRLAIPSWVRMGISEADIEKLLPDSSIGLWPEMDGYYSTGSTVDKKDQYNFRIDDKKGLIRFRIRTNNTINTVIENFTKVYGNPAQRDTENTVWNLRSGQLQSVSAIRIWYLGNNENYNIEITYYFSNDINNGIEEDKMRDTVARGYYALNSGEYDLAIRELSNVLSKNSRHDAAYNLRGRAYLGKNDLDKAISDFNQAIRLSPNRKDFHGNRANAYRRKGNLTSALEDYNAEIRIQPDSYYVIAGRGLVYMDQNKIDLAIADLKKACDSSENFCQFYPISAYFLGDLYHIHNKNYQEAIKYYTSALKMFDPEQAEIRKMIGINDDVGLLLYSARARAYFALENNDLALSDLNKVLSTPNLDELYYGSYLTRGMIFYTQEKYRETVSDLTNFLKSKSLADEDKFHALYLRAMSYTNLNNEDGVLGDLNIVLNSPLALSDYPICYYLRGTIYQKRNNYNGAITDFTNYLKAKDLSNEMRIDTLHNRASCYVNIKNYNLALNDLNIVLNNVTAVEKHPNDFFIRGIILFEQKKYKEAISDLNKVLAINKLEKNEKIEAYRYRAQAYGLIEDYYSAYDDYIELLKLSPRDSNALEMKKHISDYLGL
jgi:tetratricopeptide (TPR) repeat protein